MNTYHTQQLEDTVRMYGYDEVIKWMINDARMEEVRDLFSRTLKELDTIPDEYEEYKDRHIYEIDPLEVYKRETE